MNKQFFSPICALIFIYEKAWKETEEMWKQYDDEEALMDEDLRTETQKSVALLAVRSRPHVTRPAAARSTRSTRASLRENE